MASDWQDEEGLPEKRPDHAARLQTERRGRAIGRIAALGSLIVAAVAVVIVLASAGGSDSDDAAAHAGQAKATPQAAPPKPESKEVRNATPQADWKPFTGPVPILDYHDLGQAPEGMQIRNAKLAGIFNMGGAPNPELFVGRTDFARQMDWLDGHGYQAVTLEQVQEAWFHSGKLPPKPIVISFDDGYRPQFTFALPTLRKHGWAAVLNLEAEGSELYESNVKAMIAAGWELAAHTIQHRNLTELGPEELTEEVAGSRQILQREFKVPVANFSYPEGQFDESVVEAVEAAGYAGATTEVSGLAEKAKPYELARLEILHESHVAGLAEDLKNGEGETTEGAG